MNESSEMGQKKTAEITPTKLTLMSLPNELIDLCLTYLSPCDIVQSCNSINQRMNLLIYRFIRHIDVTSKKKSWLNKHFLSIQPLVTTLTFNHAQLQTLFPKPATITDRYSSLQSIVWRYTFDDDNRLCLSYLNVFRRKLSSIHLTLSSADGETVHTNVALFLLQDDSSITELSLQDSRRYDPMWFSFAPNILKINQHLTRLTIKLHYAHDLFILIEDLSKLEYLNVEVCEVEKKDLYNYNSILDKTTSLSPVLKELMIKALDLTYSRLLLFLQAFLKSIELLTINMSVHDQVDGNVLDSTIVSKMPHLKQFKFIFEVVDKETVSLNKGLDNLISTFRSTPYWLAHPVICYHDRSNPCFTMASLPWIWEESDSFSNEIMNYRLNTTTPLQMPDVQSIYLASTTLTLAFLKFIKKTFVNLKKMTISWHTCTVDDEVFYRKKKVMLDTITTLHYYGSTDDLESIDFFVLVPKLRRLIVDGTIVHIINGYVGENRRIAAICAQISTLHIFSNADYCDKDETKETFPYARIETKEI